MSATFCKRGTMHEIRVQWIVHCMKFMKMSKLYNSCPFEHTPLQNYTGGKMTANETPRTSPGCIQSTGQTRSLAWSHSSVHASSFWTGSGSLRSPTRDDPRWPGPFLCRTRNCLRHTETLNLSVRNLTLPVFYSRRLLLYSETVAQGWLPKSVCACVWTYMYQCVWVCMGVVAFYKSGFLPDCTHALMKCLWHPHLHTLKCKHSEPSDSNTLHPFATPSSRLCSPPSRFMSAFLFFFLI